MQLPVYIRGEGFPDVQAVVRLCQLSGIVTDFSRVTRMGGFVRLDQQLPSWNQAARYGVPFIVLRDLDAYACAPLLIEERLPQVEPLLLLRVPVRSLEAWLMADRKEFAHFLGVSRDRIPADPESLTHPKRSVRELARRSRSRAIRERMVPIDQGAKEGREYAATLAEFVMNVWSPEEAANRSPSLSTSIARFHSFAAAVRRTI